MSTVVRVEVTLSLDVDLEAYEANYGDGYPASEAVEYAGALAEESTRDRLTQVGQWASVAEVKIRKGPQKP